MAQTRMLPPTPSAHAFPLLIKSLLLNHRHQPPAQEIVYRDQRRFAYAEWLQRVGQLGNALPKTSVGKLDKKQIRADWAHF